eukprot:1709644-Amphidinium_carterae.2
MAEIHSTRESPTNRRRTNCQSTILAICCIFIDTGIENEERSCERRCIELWLPPKSVLEPVLATSSYIGLMAQ